MVSVVKGEQEALQAGRITGYKGPVHTRCVGTALDDSLAQRSSTQEKAICFVYVQFSLHHCDVVVCAEKSKTCSTFFHHSWCNAYCIPVLRPIEVNKMPQKKVGVIRCSQLIKTTAFELHTSNCILTQLLV